MFGNFNLYEFSSLWNCFSRRLLLIDFHGAAINLLLPLKVISFTRKTRFSSFYSPIYRVWKTRSRALAVCTIFFITTALRIWSYLHMFVWLFAHKKYETLLLLLHGEVPKNLTSAQRQNFSTRKIRIVANDSKKCNVKSDRCSSGNKLELTQLYIACKATIHDLFFWNIIKICVIISLAMVCYLFHESK